MATKSKDGTLFTRPPRGSATLDHYHGALRNIPAKPDRAPYPSAGNETSK